MKEEKEIDWDEVDRKAEEMIKKCALLDEQIAESRRTGGELYDLQKASEQVERVAAKHGLDVEYLDLGQEYKEEKDPTTCVTKFVLDGDFDPDEISEKLQAQPTRSWKRTELRRDKKPFGFDHWEGFVVDEYDVYVENQMRKTIAPLKDKVDVLNALRKKYDIKMSLVVVPTVYPRGIAPCLAPPLDVIDFCHDTRIEIDIDLYVME